MIEKKTIIDGKEVTLRSSALIPKMYRAHFGRDIMKDMSQLSKAYKKTIEQNMTAEEKEQAFLDVVDPEIFEDVAWCMLKHGGEDVGANPDEWLDSLDGVFSVYQALPVILELWNANTATTSVPVKK